MAEDPPKKPAKTGTLDWPIRNQLIVTGLLVGVLLAALHFASRNDATESDDDAEPYAAITEVAESAIEVSAALPELPAGWKGQRVLVTTPVLATAASDAGADCYLFADVADEAARSTLDADGLAGAESFDVIVVADIINRPPKQFAQKVTAGGLLFLLDPKGNWKAYRESAGMLRTEDQR